MHNRYFGFKKNPFSIAPDPRFLFMSEVYQDALAHLNYGLSSDSCITLLTGEVGTGKTTICRCFLQQLGDSTDVAVILNPKLSAVELLAAICDEFRIRVKGNRLSIKLHIDCLNRFLLQAYSQNRKCLLIIDEAQNLDKDVLEMVRLLTNLETNERKLLKIFLLGQPQLLTMLAHPDVSQIDQRITSRFHLRGLRPSDTDHYIRHRLSVAGGPDSGELFSRRSIRRIHQLTGGIPRLINNLCDRSLLGAYAEGKKSIDGTIIRKAADEIFGDGAHSRTALLTRGTLAVAFATTLLIIAIWTSTVDGMSADMPCTSTALTQADERH